MIIWKTPPTSSFVFRPVSQVSLGFAGQSVVDRKERVFGLYPKGPFISWKAYRRRSGKHCAGFNYVSYAFAGVCSGTSFSIRSIASLLLFSAHCNNVLRRCSRSTILFALFVRLDTQRIKIRFMHHHPNFDRDYSKTDSSYTPPPPPCKHHIHTTTSAPADRSTDLGNRPSTPRPTYSA